jgi:hypothetical protein
MRKDRIEFYVVFWISRKSWGVMGLIYKALICPEDILKPFRLGLFSKSKSVTPQLLRLIRYFVGCKLFFFCNVASPHCGFYHTHFGFTTIFATRWVW